MAKITRKTQKIFGSSAGVNELAQIGSLAAAAPAFSTDPDTIQSLTQYLQGWFAVVLGANSPAIEDMNALCFLFARQIAYVMQAGVSEWDAGTTYYIGSLVNSSGILYRSITDTNLNNVVTDTTKWTIFDGSSPLTAFNPSTQSPYAVSLANDQGKTFLVSSTNAASQFNLPAPTANFWFRVKDIDGDMDFNNCTFHRNGSEKIEALASDYVVAAPYGEWTISSNGTDWFIIGR